MSHKNPTRGQQRAAYAYEHNSGMSKEDALNKAVSQRGTDQPKSKGDWDGFEQTIGEPHYDWADTESEQ